MHAVVSNSFGLVNLTIGSQYPTDFNLIDWATGPYFIKIVIDGIEFGTSQLLSVPYALHAESSEKATLAEAVENYNETDPLFAGSLAASITQTQIENWTNKLSEFAEADPDFNASVAAGITPAQIENWNNKLSEFAETDPNFNASVAAGITLAQIETWTNKLDSFLEIDTEFAASLAKGITATDTAYWNSKLDDFVESDPTFLAHPSVGITAEDIVKWKALWIWYITNERGYLTKEIQNLADVAAINNSANTQLKNVTDPSDAQDAATKAYVDLLEAKLDALEARVSVIEPLLPLLVGDFRYGGVVFWVDPADDTHGLV